ncbi:MAG: transposase [Thermonemataceae bacterium]|nr:transposase [Thermonemataceae bacterium]
MLYSTDLTNSRWQYIVKILNDQRKRKYSLRRILDTLFYLNKTGCQWRMLPKTYPPFGICFYYYRQWTKKGTWHKINKALVQLYREKQGRKASPSLGIIDSQSIKNSAWG